MKHKLIMEGWRKFINENTCPDFSFYMDGDKMRRYGGEDDSLLPGKPLTDEEIDLLAREDECGEAARDDLKAWITHHAEEGNPMIPDFSPKLTDPPERKKKNFNVFNIFKSFFETALRRTKSHQASPRQGQEQDKEDSRSLADQQVEPNIWPAENDPMDRSTIIVVQNASSHPMRVLIDGEPLRRVLQKKVKISAGHHWRMNPDGSRPAAAEIRRAGIVSFHVITHDHPLIVRAQPVQPGGSCSKNPERSNYCPRDQRDGYGEFGYATVSEDSPVAFKGPLRQVPGDPIPIEVEFLSKEGPIRRVHLVRVNPLDGTRKLHMISGQGGWGDSLPYAINRDNDRDGPEGVRDRILSTSMQFST